MISRFTLLMPLSILIVSGEDVNRCATVSIGRIHTTATISLSCDSERNISVVDVFLVYSTKPCTGLKNDKICPDLNLIQQSWVTFCNGIPNCTTQVRMEIAACVYHEVKLVVIYTCIATLPTTNTTLTTANHSATSFVSTTAAATFSDDYRKGTLSTRDNSVASTFSQYSTTKSVSSTAIIPRIATANDDSFATTSVAVTSTATTTTATTISSTTTHPTYSRDRTSTMIAIIAQQTVPSRTDGGTSVVIIALSVTIGVLFLIFVTAAIVFICRKHAHKNNRPRPTSSGSHISAVRISGADNLYVLNPGASSDDATVQMHSSGTLDLPESVYWEVNHSDDNDEEHHRDAYPKDLKRASVSGLDNDSGYSQVDLLEQDPVPNNTDHYSKLNDWSRSGLNLGKSVVDSVASENDVTFRFPVTVVKINSNSEQNLDLSNGDTDSVNVTLKDNYDHINLSHLSIEQDVTEEGIGGSSHLMNDDPAFEERKSGETKTGGKAFSSATEHNSDNRTVVEMESSGDAEEEKRGLYQEGQPPDNHEYFTLETVSTQDGFLDFKTDNVNDH